MWMKYDNNLFYCYRCDYNVGKTHSLIINRLYIQVHAIVIVFKTHIIYSVNQTYNYYVCY